MFFEAGTQSSTRHRRLRYYLLLFALRALLILLVALAFANPFIRRAKASENDKLLLVVLDNSFSMRAGSRFAEVKQAGARCAAISAVAHRRRRCLYAGQQAGGPDPADLPIPHS